MRKVSAIAIAASLFLASTSVASSQGANAKLKIGDGGSYADTATGARNNFGINQGVNPAADYSATGNCSTDDTAALLAASSAAVSANRPLLIDRCYLTSSATLAANVVFVNGGYFSVASGQTLTLNGQISAQPNSYIFQGSGSAVVTASSFVSVAWWGALVASDPTFAFRAAVGSNRLYYVPPGSYLFHTATFATDPVLGRIPGVDPTVVFVDHAANLRIEAFGASFNIDDANSHSHYFVLFDISGNSYLHGGTYLGNRAGQTAGQENGAFAIISATDFDIGNLAIAGNYGGVGSGIAGDFLVNVVAHDITMRNIGIGFDLAFLQNFRATNITCRGISADGTTGVGRTCFSNVIGGFQGSGQFNLTGVSLPDTRGVVIDNMDASNLTAGISIASGAGYIISNSRLHDNTGIAATAQGTGIHVTYIATGPFTSVGFPPHDITIDNSNRIYNNGAIESGAGVLISGSPIVNGDIISNIRIAGDFNNNTASAVQASGVTHIANVTVAASTTFEGVNQTTTVPASLGYLLGQVYDHVGTGTALSSTVVAEIASFDFQPGEYEISANFIAGVDATTTVANFRGGLSLTSAVIPSAIGYFADMTFENLTPGQYTTPTEVLGPVHFSFAAPTTVYCNASAVFAVSTLNGTCSIHAVRVGQQ
jgi:hypothetical protein